MFIKPVEDEFIIAGDTTLHYVQWGTQGKPLVCLHTLTSHLLSYQAFADALSAEYRVIAYDLRGRGDSDRPEDDYAIQSHATDLAELLDELGLEQPAILGHGLGANIAVYFAAHYPEKLSKLILIDGGTPLRWSTPSTAPAWQRETVARLSVTFPSSKTYVEQLKKQPFLGPYWNEYADLAVKHDIRPEPDGTFLKKAYLQGVIEEGLRYNEARPEAQWEHIRVPTLFLRAGQSLLTENDQFVSEETGELLPQKIADLTYINYPTLNHYTIVLGVEPGPAEAIRTFLA